ncbi:hypothetical protein [Clostridium beijerinckii]|uniref:hypothetical protein n=1 Tax=Clostridium beijerinckii TaxID=1520 RepID=UPI00156DC26C|nr:hypothetical protein [Clostridium beijerinckii]NRU52594.1 hypothetical protein [Clostridium beijerinckii]NYC68637.1 hypothetical protein [Clostridium beijerinckii]
MAGSAKPSVAGLGSQAQYTVIGVVGSQGSGGTVSNCGLFDGTTVNEWNTSHVMYWSGSSTYLEINIISSKVNIWRCGTTSWIGSKAPLQILQWNGSAYIDVTTTYAQTLNSITETQWEKTIANLPSGRYKFVGVNARLDSEWYIESVESKYLINSSIDNKLYTIASGAIVQTSATTTSDKFIAGFSINDLTSTILTSNTLKSLSPFKLISFNTTNDAYTKISVNATTTISELIVLNQSINTKLATSITKYFTDKTLSGNGNIKVVVSNDDMLTWKTWNGTSWISLTNTIVNKSYTSMSTTEKTQWDTFKNEIASVGMTDTILQSADFNQFIGQNLRFAFVLIKPTYNDTAVLKDLQWNYIGKDNYVLLNNSDVKVSLNEDFIQLTPTRNITKVKANIIT